MPEGYSQHSSASLSMAQDAITSVSLRGQQRHVAFKIISTHSIPHIHTHPQMHNFKNTHSFYMT